jgi:choice-of-anchor B domain-containing protein
MSVYKLNKNMKNLLIILFQICLLNTTFSQATMTLLSHWDDETLPVASPNNLKLQYNSIWGHVANGHEIAILCNARFILFFDVTNPTQPEQIGKFEGSATTVWRELKSYKNRVYCVSDNTLEGLMIFDLTNAPDTIVQTYWSNEFFNSSHSIALDTASGHIYLNGSSAASSGMMILDVSQNPDQPTVLTNVTLPGGYIHDSYVINDTLYASSGYSGLFVYDFKTNPLVPTTIADVTTGGYNHNSAITADGKYLFYAEEIPKGQPIQVVDLQTLNTGEIETVHSFLDPQLADPAGPLAIPHNVFIKQNYLYVSQYEDGLLVYDITNPLAPILINTYDTHPENLIYNGYFGCWGNYPWLPSGNILASDMQNGLFVLKPEPFSSPTIAPEKSALSMSISPNPTSGFLTINVKTDIEWSYQLLDLTGKLIKENLHIFGNSHTFESSLLPDGVYFLKVTDKNGFTGVQKVVFSK